MELPAIEWHRIRTVQGSQAGGFEQLVVELFEREQNLVGKLVRVNGAGGDGGLEAFAKSEGGGTIGVQAKYFRDLGAPQWKQIDESARTALKHYPDLTHYHVYVPLDRTTGIRGGHRRQGQLERWESLTETWKSVKRAGNVTFIWHGKHEIESALKATSNHDLLYYWFHTPTFTREWLDQKLQEAFEVLGVRYQRDRHVDSAAGRQLDQFVWSAGFEGTLQRQFARFAKRCAAFRKDLAGMILQPPAGGRVPGVLKAIGHALHVGPPAYGGTTVEEMLEAVREIIEEVEDLAEEIWPSMGQAEESKSDLVRNQLGAIEEFERPLREYRDRLRDASGADKTLAFVRGEAGTGKSHLLARCADTASKHGQPVLLLPGERFTNSEPPLHQICKLLHWEHGPKALLSALSVAGSMAKRPALLMIDALNESADRRIWRSHLASLAAEVGQFRNLRLIVSCRDDFVDITMPDGFRQGTTPDWCTVWHDGLGDVLFEAVSSYFKAFRIKATHFPPLLPEFANPLFLATFCQAFEGASLPPGPITLSEVMGKRVDQIAVKLEADIGCEKYHTNKALLDLADRITENHGLAVSEDVARTAIEPYSPSKEASRSLYKHLLSSEIIVEHREWVGVGESPLTKVRFAYERFSDYFIAEKMLASVHDASTLRRATEAGGKLAWVGSWDAYRNNRGTARALSILVPERFSVELVDLFPAADHRGNLLLDLADTLPWRNRKFITANTEERLFEASNYGSPEVFVESLLRMVSIPEHPFNARFLHSTLKKLKLNTRDAIWTIPIVKLSGREAGTPSMIVEWALRSPKNLISDAQALLVATVLLWFCSSTRVAFRDRASQAAIKILTGRPKVVIDLLAMFDKVDDPYVVERLYAVACGVAMREQAGEGLRLLSKKVYRLVYGTRYVRPHILLRDYAQGVLAAAKSRYCLDESVKMARVNQRYKSRMPKIVGETVARQIEADSRWSRIVASVRPEGIRPGFYGDFGRYAMGSRVHRFLNVRRDRPIPPEPFKHRFDDNLARRWVLQRVRALGWTSGHFGQHDDRLHDKMITSRETKVERIGKKYQWIALHELLGYLSDHYHMLPDWGSRSLQFRGAWQLYAREFDPSEEPQPIKWGNVAEDEESIDAESREIEFNYKRSYENPFSDGVKLADRKAWVISKPPEPQDLLVVRREGGGQDWLVLGGFWKWEEPDLERHRNGWAGACEMWIHARSWLVAKDATSEFVARISKLHFWGHGVDGVSLDEGWIGEYPYGVAFADLDDRCEAPDSFTGRDSCLHIRTTCEWSPRYAPMVPSPKVCRLINGRWSGAGGIFSDPSGMKVAQSARLPDSGDSNCSIVRRDVFEAGLAASGLQLVWAVVGERQCRDGANLVGNVELQFSGVYRLTKDDVDGRLTVVKQVDLPPA